MLCWSWELTLLTDALTYLNGLCYHSSGSFNLLDSQFGYEEGEGV